MKLTLNNIGKIHHASIDINGITVIAGENNTGKSTVGKVLFSIFNSFYNLDTQMQEEREETIASAVDILYRNMTKRMTTRVNSGEIAKGILDNAGQYLESKRALREYIDDSIRQYDETFGKSKASDDVDSEKFYENMLFRIMDVLQISDEEIIKSVLDKKFEVEFNGQINNIFSENEGVISLQIKDLYSEIKIIENEIAYLDGSLNLRTEVIYIDDPFVIDETRSYPPIARYRNRRYLTHREHLQSKLFMRENDNSIISEILISDKLNSIYSKINSICNGEIINKRAMIGYREPKNDAVLNIKNLSTGLKTFVILKMLLQKGELEENGTIVLDEPEIHLHPEWQLLFAELIVLIQKEFDMHILLNTHSPYFLNALEVYSARHNIAEKCKYYLASHEGELAIIEDVTNEIDKIYEKLAIPLQRLESERYGDND